MTLTEFSRRATREGSGDILVSPSELNGSGVMVAPPVYTGGYTS